jgi:hypothetical protein
LVCNSSPVFLLIGFLLIGFLLIGADGAFHQLADFATAGQAALVMPHRQKTGPDSTTGLHGGSGATIELRMIDQKPQMVGCLLDEVLNKADQGLFPPGKLRRHNHLTG